MSVDSSVRPSLTTLPSLTVVLEVSDVVAYSLHRESYSSLTDYKISHTSSAAWQNLLQATLALRL